MLYNRSTGKPNPISIDGLIAWLKQQDPKGSYNWYDSKECVMCRYMNVVIGTERHHDLGAVFPNLEMYQVICAARPWTYGAVLNRLEAWERGYRPDRCSSIGALMFP